MGWQSVALKDIAIGRGVLQEIAGNHLDGGG